jgi:hypothetical protein
MKTSRGLSPNYTVLIGGVCKQGTKEISETMRGYSRKIEHLCTSVQVVYTYGQILFLAKMYPIIWHCSPLKVTANIRILIF